MSSGGEEEDLGEYSDLGLGSRKQCVSELSGGYVQFAARRRLRIPACHGGAQPDLVGNCRCKIMPRVHICVSPS